MRILSGTVLAFLSSAALCGSAAGDVAEIAFDRPVSGWEREYMGEGFSLEKWWMGPEIAGGFDVTGVNASNTITANRIEWNRLGGMRIHQGRHYCINANYFDRSGTAGLQMTDSENITFTGNQFWRSGRPQWERPAEPYSAHAVIRNCRGITFSSNNMNAGRDDDRKGEYSPRTGLVLEKLTDCVVMGNTAHRAYLEKFIDDRGGHVNTVVRDNVGSPMGEPIVLNVGVDE